MYLDKRFSTCKLGERIASIEQNHKCPFYQDIRRRHAAVESPELREFYKKHAPHMLKEVIQKDWSAFQKNMFQMGVPTPTLDTPEKEREFYRKLEQKDKEEQEERRHDK